MLFINNKLLKNMQFFTKKAKKWQKKKMFKKDKNGRNI